MKFEIELDDKGDFVGQLPAEVAEAHKRIGIMSHGNGFQAGKAKAEEEAKAALANAIAAERAKLEAQMPLEREKWQGVESENNTLKQQLTDTLREHSKTLTKREEAHAEEVTKRAAAIEKRNTKIQSLVASNIRALAAQSGAREESLDEIEFYITAKHIGFDEDMEPYVKGVDGKPAKSNTGNPVPIDAFVKHYLETHPNHLKPRAGTGGGARGGASFHGHTGPQVSAQAAAERIEGGDRSATAINALFEATRKRAS